MKWPVTFLEITAKYNIHESQNTPQTSNAAHTNIEQQIDTIILKETDTTTPEDKHDAIHGRHPFLALHVAPGLLITVIRCADRIVSRTTADQQPNQQFGSVHQVHYGQGKQFNRIQSGSFEHRCAAAGLANQHGPGWMTSFWT